MRDPYQAWENQVLDEFVFENAESHYGELIDDTLTRLRESGDPERFTFNLTMALARVGRGDYIRDHPQMAIEGLSDVVSAARRVAADLGIFDPICPDCGGQGMTLGSTGPTGDDPERPCDRCQMTGRV